MKRQIEGKEYELTNEESTMCEDCAFHDDSKRLGEQCKISHLHEVMECINENGIWKEVNND